MEEFNRQIRSGETFLYREDGVESQVFEIRMKEKIVDSHVFSACDKAFRRYPYLNSRLRLHKDGNYYLEKSPTMPIPQRRKHLRPLGSVATKYAIIDITFSGRSIYVSFHHAMCDGMGIMPFVKTLTYYYLSARYPRKKFTVPDLRMSGEALLPGETLDPAVDGNFDFDPGKVFRIDGRNAFRLPEVGEGAPEYSRWEIEIGEAPFVEKAKENGCSPVILASILLQKAILSVHPEADKPVMSNVVCDWRGALEVPNTFRNCVSCVYLPFSQEDGNKPLKEVGMKDRELLSKQREVNSARASASVIRMLSDRLQGLPGVEEKEGMMKMMSGHIVDSFTMSYLGRANFGDMEEYIDGLHIYTSGDRGLTVEMTAISGKMVLDLKQSFPQEEYLKAFISECGKVGLAPTRVSVRIPFEIPKDTSRKLGFFERCGNFFAELLGKGK